MRGFAPGDPRNGKLERKRQEILDAARTQLLELGAEKVNAEAIAARSGISKMTIYRHFGTSEGLFEAVILSMVGSFQFQDLDAESSDHVPAALFEFGLQFGTALMTPESLKLYKAIITSAERAPKLALAFQEKGRLAAQKVVAAFLAKHIAVDTGEALFRARAFDALVLGDLYQQCLLGVSEFDAERLSAQVGTAVTIALLKSSHEPKSS